MLHLQKYFDTVINSSDDIKKLRELILTLAMRGKLVPQDPNDEPASTLIKEIFTVKRQLENDGHIKPSRHYDTISYIDVPYELPDGWEWCRLNHVLDVRDGTHDTPKYVDVGYPLITSKNLSSGTLSFDDVKYISEQDHQSISARSVVVRGDILFAMIGSIGNPVIVDCDIPFSIKNVALFKFYKSGLPVNRYIHLYLKSAENTMKAKSSGAVQSFVSLGFLRNHLIPLPPLNEQNRIVEKVVQLMAVCDRLEEMQHRRDTTILSAHSASIKRLIESDNVDEFSSSWEFICKHFDVFYSTKENVEELKKAILVLAVHGNLNKLKASINYPLGYSMHRISNKNPSNPIPCSWEWHRLGNIVKVRTGKKDVNECHKEGQYPFFSCAKEPLKSQTYSYDMEALLLPGNGANVGQVTYFNGKFEAYQRTYILSDFGSNSAHYIKLALDAYFKKSLEGKQYGSAINYIKLSSLTEFHIPLPPRQEQDMIVELVNMLMPLFDRLEETMDTATNKRDQLLESIIRQVTAS